MNTCHVTLETAHVFKTSITNNIQMAIEVKFTLFGNTFTVSIAHVEQNLKVVKNIRLVALLRSYVAAVANVGRKNRKNCPTLATAAT